MFSLPHGSIYLMLLGSSRLNTLPAGGFIVVKLFVPTLLDVGVSEVGVEVKILSPQAFTEGLMVLRQAT
jgi:hypothetical protein